MSSVYQGNSIFWVEIQKIRPNPFQPRREFDEHALQELAESIRQYGILQPLVVTRREEQKPDGGISVYYELIAGERRLRAAKIAGLEQVPVIIRNDTDDKLRLELAILENLQREDLNPVDRALAFEQLHKQFGLTHTEIGKRMGRSRVYVSNTMRILSLPEEMKLGLISGKIHEGHTRPLLMLSDRPEEQKKLYEEIILRKLSVRDAEKIARRIAQDKVRKKKFIVDPRIREYEKRLSENLGTRVHIEQKERGGKILIDYFSMEDLENILNALRREDSEERGGRGREERDVFNSSPNFSPQEGDTSSERFNSFQGERREYSGGGEAKKWGGDEVVRSDGTSGFSEEILRFAESHGIELAQETGRGDRVSSHTEQRGGDIAADNLSSVEYEDFRREEAFQATDSGHEERGDYDLSPGVDFSSTHLEQYREDQVFPPHPPRGREVRYYEESSFSRVTDSFESTPPQEDLERMDYDDALYSRDRAQPQFRGGEAMLAEEDREKVKTSFSKNLFSRYRTYFSERDDEEEGA